MVSVNITFEEILAIWKNKLWHNRKSIIEKVSCMVYLGGFDTSIYNNNPTYFAIIKDNKILAVNSGHMSTNQYYRSRGLWVDENYRRKGLTYILFDALYKQARLEKAKYIWSFPRENSLHAYIKNGFTISSNVIENELGPHYYVIKKLI